MTKGYLFLLLSFLIIGYNTKSLSGGLPNQAIENQLCSMVDTSVDGIHLLNPDSTRKVIGYKIEYLKDTEGYFYTQFYNRDGYQMIMFVSQSEDQKDSFKSVQIVQINKRFLMKIGILKHIENFKTGKGIHLGMNITKLKKILGLPSTEETNDYGVILHYRCDNKKIIPTNTSHYFGNYTFYNNKLINIQFGFK